MVPIIPQTFSLQRSLILIHSELPRLNESSTWREFSFAFSLNQFGQREESGKAMANGANDDGAPHAEDTNDGDGLHHLVVDASETRRLCPPVTGIFSQSIILHTHFDPHLYPKLMALNSLEVRKF